SLHARLLRFGLQLRIDELPGLVIFATAISSGRRRRSAAARITARYGFELIWNQLPVGRLGGGDPRADSGRTHLIVRWSGWTLLRCVSDRPVTRSGAAPRATIQASGGSAAVRDRVALGALMVVIGCASKEAAWHRIPDVSGVPWEHAQAICGPILEQGAIAR